MLLVASLGVLEIWYNNDDDVSMIVITTSASYTMEGTILWMPFTTLTESGLEMMFCLTSGNSSFSRDKKSGCSRLMININILKGHWNIWWLMTESFTIPNCRLLILSVQWHHGSWHCTVTSLDSCLIFFAWLSPSAFFRERCYCLYCKVFVCESSWELHDGYGSQCDCTSAVTRSGSDSSSCLLSFISIAINRYFRTPKGNERLGRTIHIFFGDWDFFILYKGFRGRWARKSKSRPRQPNTFQQASKFQTFLGP